MRKRAFSACAILAAFTLVALFMPDRATAFNDYMDTVTSPQQFPPTTWTAGGWTVNLVGNGPTAIAASDGTTRYVWHYQIYRTSTQSAAGLLFVALLVPNCYDGGCGNFCTNCPNAITSWVAPVGNLCLAGNYCDPNPNNASGFHRVFDVGYGENRFAFGHGIMQGYVVKGSTAFDSDDVDLYKCPAGNVTDWRLETNTSWMTTTTIFLRTLMGQIPMVIAGPGCAPPAPPQASASLETISTLSGHQFVVQPDLKTGCDVAIYCLPPNTPLPSGCTGPPNCPNLYCNAGPLNQYLSMMVRSYSNTAEPVATISSPGVTCANAVIKPQGACPAFISNEPWLGSTKPTGTVYTFGSCQ
ncbi:MAG TPA: hypothetical protein VEF34_19865 [Syntrophobacteraceae bacterium]|nr:hypothetical protein [Syntrophobacteraceae bacterium]